MKSTYKNNEPEAVLEDLRRLSKEWPGVAGRRMFLGGMQVFLDDRLFTRLPTWDTHTILKPGEDIAFRYEITLVEKQLDKFIDSWRRFDDVLVWMQEYVDRNTEGVYITALTPDTLPVYVKAGWSEDYDRRHLMYRTIVPDLEILERLPRHRARRPGNQDVFERTVRDRLARELERIRLTEVFRADTYDAAKAAAAKMKDYFID